MNKKILINALVLLVCSNTTYAMPDDFSQFVLALKTDMGNNEKALLNPPIGPQWTKRAIINMAGTPQGSATPSWWKPANTTYKTDKFWNAITPWFVIYPAEGHQPSTAQIQLSGLKVFIYSKSRQQWQLVNAGNDSVTWAGNWSFVNSGRISKASLQSGPVSTLQLDSAQNPIHGGTRKFTINGADVQAVFATVESQLVADNGSAKLLLSVGADFYPDAQTQISDFAPMKYVPASGASRFTLIRSQKQRHYFISPDVSQCVEAKHAICSSLQQLWQQLY